MEVEVIIVIMIDVIIIDNSVENRYRVSDMSNADFVGGSNNGNNGNNGSNGNNIEGSFKNSKTYEETCPRILKLLSQNRKLSHHCALDSTK